LQLQLRLAAGFDVEADHMCCEVDAQPFQFRAQRTGIGLAGFIAVTDQDHRGLVLGETQLFGGAAYGGGNRRHAFRIQCANLPADRGRVEPGRLDQKLDVLAISLAPVAVGDQAQIAVVPALQHHIHCVACNRDLWPAIDLAPHRTGRIEHEDGSRRGRGLRAGGCTGQRAGGLQAQR